MRPLCGSILSVTTLCERFTEKREKHHEKSISFLGPILFSKWLARLACLRNVAKVRLKHSKVRL